MSRWQEAQQDGESLLDGPDDEWRPVTLEHVFGLKTFADQIAEFRGPNGLSVELDEAAWIVLGRPVGLRVTLVDNREQTAYDIRRAQLVDDAALDTKDLT